jgi:TrmH RNA methyltransferase
MARPDRRLDNAQGPAGPAAQDEAKLCGLNACLAVFAKRPDDIVRAYVTQAQLAAAGDLLSWCAKQHRAYHMVTNEEMDRITQSSHHEGICLLVKPPLRITLEQLCMRLATQTGPVCVLLLEGITNPHNFGAILRVAAHFGGAAVVQCGTEDAPPRLSAAVCRTAEGAAEQIAVIQVGDARSAVERLRRCALQVVATSSHATTSLYGRGMPRRCLLLLGSEAEGLSKGLAEVADAVVSIPGTNWVESLNVACATAVLMAEFRRTQPWLPPPAPVALT